MSFFQVQVQVHVSPSFRVKHTSRNESGVLKSAAGAISIPGEPQLSWGQGQHLFWGGGARQPSEWKTRLLFLPTLRQGWILINTLCQLLIAFAACC